MTDTVKIYGHDIELYDPDGGIVTDVIIISRAVYPGEKGERDKDGFGIMTSPNTTGTVATGMLVKALRHDENNDLADHVDGEEEDD